MLRELKLAPEEFPFKYLGVPLSIRKLSISQCMPLVEKMIARLKCWSSKLLAYSGRLQLVKSVLFEMQIYWVFPRRSLPWLTLFTELFCGHVVTTAPGKL